jgi:hypothetical protein
MKISGFDAMKPMWTGVFFLVAAIAVAAIPADASARHHKHLAYRHGLGHHVRNAQAFVVVTTPSTTLGSMRYYGGPKSPMWRQVD